MTIRTFPHSRIITGTQTDFDSLTAADAGTNYLFINTTNGRISLSEDGLIWITIRGADKTETFTNKTINFNSNTIQNIYPYITVRKRGTDPCSATASGWDGLLLNGITLQSAPTVALLTTGVNGNGLSFTSTTTNSNSGRRTVNAIFRRAHNPKIRIRFNVPATDSITRVYFGFSTTTNFTTDTPLGTGDSGLLFWHGTGDSTYKIWANDSLGGAASVTDTTVNLTTSVIIAEITANDSVPNFVVKLFDTSQTELGSWTITTQIPASTTNMFLLYGFSVSSTPHKVMNIYGVDTESI